MRSIIAIALKDIRLLLRDRMAAFFVLGFPLLMGLFFGLMMNPGSGGKKSKIKVAIVDQDQSKYSKLLLQALEKNENIAVEVDQADAARASVQSGKRVAMLVIPKGFGETAGMFWEKQPAIQLGVDPSRSAEGGMLEGFIMEAVGGLVGKRITNPSEILGSTEQWKEDVRKSQDLSTERKSLLLAFFGEFDGFIDSLSKVQTDRGEQASESTEGEVDFRLATIEKLDVTEHLDPRSVQGQVRKIKSRWDISFPQAMLWGVLGCVSGFSISIAKEREDGTLLRLCVTPIHRGQLLCGKALACFLSALGVMAIMTAIGMFLGLRPLSFPKLGLAVFSVAVCFVGIMMVLSTLGKSVQSVSGIGWASNMIMAMIGGCMIPIMFMPEFIATISVLSPVRWALQSLEGAIWRDFTWMQLINTASVLWAIGIAGLVISVVKNRRLEA